MKISALSNEYLNVFVGGQISHPVHTGPFSLVELRRQGVLDGLPVWHQLLIAAHLGIVGLACFNSHPYAYNSNQKPLQAAVLEVAQAPRSILSKYGSNGRLLAKQIMGCGVKASALTQSFHQAIKPKTYDPHQLALAMFRELGDHGVCGRVSAAEVQLLGVGLGILAGWASYYYNRAWARQTLVNMMQMILNDPRRYLREEFGGTGRAYCEQTLK